VVELKRQGKELEAARIAKDQGADLVSRLNERVDELIEYSDNKAAFFTRAANDADRQGLLSVVILMTAIIIAAIGLSIHSARRINRAQLDIERFNQLIDQSSDAIYIIDEESGRFLDVNSAACRSMGYSKEEMLGLHVWDLSGVISNIGGYRGRLTDLDETGSTVFETRHVRRDGTTFPVEISIRRVEEGAKSLNIAISRDITDRKRAEKELEMHRRHLEDLVKARTLDIESARDEAEAAREAKATFLANVSHEIRTPLNTIIDMSHLLLGSRLDGEQRLKMAKIQTAAEQLLSLMSDILDISNIDAGKLKLEYIPLRIDEVARSVASMLRDQAAEKGLQLNIEIPTTVPTLVGDQLRLTQVLLNLVGNAIKFTEQGSVTIRCELEDAVDECVPVRFEVRDTGQGIAVEEQQALFEAFGQVDSSINRRGGGTGLGLALCKLLVESMGGNIGVESQPAEGSIFWFTVLLQEGCQIRDGDETGAGWDELRNLVTESGHTPMVLIVENDIVNREVAKQLVKRSGCRVEVAGNGAEAVEKLEHGLNCDLVLMDMQMPVMDGLEATRVIREGHAIEQLPIIAMAADAFAEDRALCLQAGMNDFMTKPIDPKRLYTILFKWISKRLARH